jgi:hypothetical protein
VRSQEVVIAGLDLFLSLPVFGEGKVGFFFSLLASLADPTPALPEDGEGAEGFRYPMSAPAPAQSSTTSHGGVFHTASKRKAASATAKSSGLPMAAVHTGL